MKSFKDKVAVVTGAGSGIGRHLALQLAQAGARLAISDVSENGLAETLRLMPAGAEVRRYRVDVARKDEVFAHADQVLRDFGSAHYIFNNAGVSLTATIAHASIEEIEWQLGINLWGVIYGTKAFLPILLQQKEGHIINLSSVFGLVAVAGQSAYNVSKFGVRGWTECLWQELEGSGVQATCVHPGGIRTAIAQTGRLAANADHVEQRLQALAGKLLVTPPEDMAATILDGVARGKKRIVYGSKAATLTWLQRLLPVSYGKVLQAMERFL
ncbi:SDR family NAD(P)-dependent oxidoreductase [Collimonas pratensis]|uniref:SDR family NAD(P)-dependent oxidoreductase n=1 Tax=Collimonas pratensis TaxID=279113 RepID=UPI00143DA788|nr:SDR family oxidoreductase [Collimonas pratensis]NKI71090.1 SDR family NAD(P)-dependent oxidoreductase [Collimonas pratensis]